MTSNLELLRMLYGCAHTLRASGKYRGQGRLLNLLREHGAMTQKELVELTDRRSATLSEQLESMERAGFLTRQKNQKDQRSLVVALTPEGKAAAAEAHAEWLRRAEAFEGLSQEEKETLAVLLSKVSEAGRARQTGKGDASD